jgi:hypothetical protein
MTASARIIRLDVETPETELVPVGTGAFHLRHTLNATNVTQDHDRPKVGKPVQPKGLQGQRVDHGVGVSAFNLLVQVVSQIREKPFRDSIRREERDQGRDRHAIPERDWSRKY